MGDSISFSVFVVGILFYAPLKGVTTPHTSKVSNFYWYFMGPYLLNAPSILLVSLSYGALNLSELACLHICFAPLFAHILYLSFSFWLLSLSMILCLEHSKRFYFSYVLIVSHYVCILYPLHLFVCCWAPGLFLHFTYWKFITIFTYLFISFGRK